MGELIESSRYYDVYNFSHYGNSTLDSEGGDNVLFRLSYANDEKSQKLVQLTFQINKCDLMAGTISPVKEIRANFYNSHTLSLHVFVWDFVMNRKCSKCLFLLDSAYLEYFNMHVVYLLIFDMYTDEKSIFKLETKNFIVDLSADYELLEIENSSGETTDDKNNYWVLRKTIKNEKFEYYRLSLDQKSMEANLELLSKSPVGGTLLIQSECLIKNRAYFLDSSKPVLHFFDFRDKRWYISPLNYPTKGFFKNWTELRKADPRLVRIGDRLRIATTNPESFEIIVKENFSIELSECEKFGVGRSSVAMTYGDKCKMFGSNSGSIMVRSQSQCGSHSYLNFVNRIPRFPTLKDLSIRNLCKTFGNANICRILVEGNLVPTSIIRNYFGPDWSLANCQLEKSSIIDIPCSTTDIPFRSAGPF